MGSESSSLIIMKQRKLPTKFSIEVDKVVKIKQNICYSI